MSTASQHPAVVGDSVPEAQHVLSKDDFLKLMLPDSPLVEEGRRKVSDHEGCGATLGTHVLPTTLPVVPPTAQCTAAIATVTGVRLLRMEPQGLAHSRQELQPSPDPGHYLFLQKTNRLRRRGWAAIVSLELLWKPGRLPSGLGSSYDRYMLCRWALMCWCDKGYGFRARAMLRSDTQEPSMVPRHNWPSNLSQ